MKYNHYPFGFIYLAINMKNRKVYVGKVEYPRTIEIRWKDHLKEGRKIKRIREQYPNRKIYATHLNNAIAKYGPEIWDVRKIDITFSRIELNERERFLIKKYDAMNPAIGYNMTEGGEGGRPSQEVIEIIRKKNKEKWKEPTYRKRICEATSAGLKKKWQEPEFREKVVNGLKKKRQEPEYREKKIEAIRSLWKNPDYKEKQRKIIKKRWENPQFKENHREKLREVWNNQKFKLMMSKKLSKAVSEKWQDPEYRQKQIEGHKKLRKEIQDRRTFLRELKNGILKKDLMKKYKMSKNTINVRIYEILGKYGVINYREARKFLENKEINTIFED